MGCGINISNLRPNEAKVNNSAQTSSGAVSFMGLYNAVGGIIGASNKKKGETAARRAALMIGLSCSHPDIEEFLNIKKNNTEIQSANISILFNDEFMKCVKNNQNYTLSFETEHETITKVLNARNFFMEYAENNHGYAEPGAIFIDNVRKNHLLSGYPESEYKIDISNPCAEFYGNAYNACNLGSINLYSLVTNPFTEKASIDWKKLKENTKMGVIALDEILDYGREMQPLDANRICLDDWRSIGLGVFGLADMFIALGIKYGSAESVKIVDDIMMQICHTALETSSDLAAEKGVFGKYNWEYIKKAPIIAELQTTDPILYEKIKTNGLRNGSLLSIAPTGSISTMCGLSGGVEPLFAISYQRTTHSLSGEKKYFKVFAKSVEDLLKYKGIDYIGMDEQEIVKLFPFVTVSHEINPFDRITIQSVMQKYVDNAISSTVNLKNEVTVRDVFDIYLAAWEAGCKGLTVFRNGCNRTAILVTNDSKQLKEDTKVTHRFDSIVPVKRKNLPDDLEYPTKSHHRHTACVRNMYAFTTEHDGNLFEVFTINSGGCQSNIGTITRLVSLALRSGIKVEEIVSELKANVCPACIKMREQGDKKVSSSCGAAIADIIEKAYHKEIVVDTSGLIACPECGEKTLRPEGKCYTCHNCRYTKCD